MFCTTLYYILNKTSSPQPEAYSQLIPSYVANPAKYQEHQPKLQSSEANLTKPPGNIV